MRLSARREWVAAPIASSTRGRQTRVVQNDTGSLRPGDWLESDLDRPPTSPEDVSMTGGSQMNELAYLTQEHALLCASCAMRVPDRANGGGDQPLGLTAVPIEKVVDLWPEACCEECGDIFA